MLSFPALARRTELWGISYSFTKQQILDCSKLKQFKFDENGRKCSKLVEYTVGKGEIAH